MDERWEVHNRHRTDGVEAFAREDPTLRRLSRLPLVHESGLLGILSALPPGIYTLGGGRQVGKTTLVKQLMLRLLSRGDVAPDRLAYLTGELFADANDLREVIAALVSRSGPHHVIVDEITYVREWDKAVKFLADAGILDGVVLLLTGSDLVLIQDALKRLPGRRGPAATVDFHYRPLDFFEYCSLRGNQPPDVLASLAEGPPGAETPVVAGAVLESIETEFLRYHRTGGYLSAINDLEEHGDISPATLRIYSDWVRGDVVRRGRNEGYLREVLEAILSRYTSQVTWNALARDLSIDHPRTVSEYCHLLERMDAVFELRALREDRLSAAPKKARKLYFADPFIYHAMRHHLAGGPAPVDGPGSLRNEGELAGLVEGSIAALARRAAPTFYIKGEAGEVDVAYVRGRRFWPIEVKWSGQLRPKDLKQAAKYPNALIAGPVRQDRKVSGIPVRPAPVVALRLSRMGVSVPPDPGPA